MSLTRRELFCSIFGGIIGGTMMSLAKPAPVCAFPVTTSNDVCERAQVLLTIRESDIVRVIVKPVPAEHLKNPIRFDDMPNGMLEKIELRLGNDIVFSTPQSLKLYEGNPLLVFCHLST